MTREGVFLKLMVKWPKGPKRTCIAKEWWKEKQRTNVTGEQEEKK